MTITYNAPPGTPSDIGPQAVLLKYEKQALIVARQKQYLHELAPQAKSIPRNMGKTIVQDLYVPILDDRNTFAEGLAADGTTVIAGNLYGSSKDVAAITAKLPLVNENSNRPNRVGLTRLQRTATITRLGMFLEWSDEAEAFDSDSQLISHFSTELVNAACKISEDVLMMHLLAGATTIRYAGTATSRATITGEGGVNAVSLVRYRDIQALSIMLDQAETPKSFKMYTGTNLTDTRTISSARPMFIGNELQPTVENMLDSNSQPAFIQVFKYAAGGAVLNGEIGTLYHFRVVVHPDMQHWSDGANLAVAATPNGYLWADLTQDKYRVFPMLVVGDDAFATVGFQTTQNGTKFQIIINKPGAGMATLDNPYGNKGFSSIQWWYATLIQQPERLA